MDRLREMTVFAAAAEAGGFAKAGARLRLSPPAVTRIIATLEDRLGVRLFTRTTRRLAITEAGTRFLEASRRVLADVETAEKDAAGEAAVPQGHLRITASATFGREVLTPVVARFLEAHPRVTASLVLLDRVVNLVEEGLDLGIRIGDLPDSSLLARHLGLVRRVLVASPAYVAARGAPKTPAELKGHDVIAFTSLMPGRELRFADTGARAKKGEHHVTLTPRLEVNDAAAAIAAAAAGEGIVPALSYMVAKDIRARRLVRVLARFEPAALPVQIIYPPARLMAPKLRAFIDFAAPRLQRALAALEI
ncbi:MAG: LysR substrate-binding domain-containing protein [Rhodospirillaceae bacterium]|nr:LysR substrate-binding domain-containing protein [Rhodospirillaceae bacterium]